jgi:hypothetical protein
MQLGEARRAIKAGQLDRACAIVEQKEIRDFRQARELSAELAGRVAQRARGRFEAGYSRAGWNDLELARHMAGSDAGIEDLRQEYRERHICRAIECLAEGRTAAAQQELAKVRERGLLDPDVRWLEHVTAKLTEAEQRLAAGGSSEARQMLDALAGSVREHTTTLDAGPIFRRIEKLAATCDEHANIASQLHTSAERHDWHDVLGRADRMLALAPRDRVARTARRQAWHAVGLDATHVYHGGGRHHASLAMNDTANAARPTSAPDDTMTGSAAPERIMLWVDAVGGFLVCLDDEVVLGQPTPGSSIAVPICADLSRRHAVLRRDGGSYTLDPLGDVTVDGRKLTGPMVLGNRHEIQLGSAVRMEFTRPHALSATARLVMLSGHRTEPRADTVLLMADSCLLGPKSHSHIACRRWVGDVMLFRLNGRLHCRSTMAMNVDGVAADGPMVLESGARIEGEEFAISLEEV